jgi:hypothetical protein
MIADRRRIPRAHLALDRTVRSAPLAPPAEIV